MEGQEARAKLHLDPTYLHKATMTDQVLMLEEVEEVEAEAVDSHRKIVHVSMDDAQTAITSVTNCQELRCLATYSDATTSRDPTFRQ